MLIDGYGMKFSVLYEGKVIVESLAISEAMHQIDTIQFSVDNTCSCTCIMISAT